VARFDELRNPLWLMLAVTINRNDTVKAVFNGKLKGTYQAGPVPAVLRMSHQTYVIAGRKQLGSPIGGAIVHNQDFRRIPADFVKDVVHESDFVVHRQGSQGPKGHGYFVVLGRKWSNINRSLRDIPF